MNGFTQTTAAEGNKTFLSNFSVHPTQRQFLSIQHNNKPETFLRIQHNDRTASTQ